MGALTDSVLGLALADLARWRSQGRDVQVSLNVGAEVLSATSFLPALEHRLDQHALPPGALCLEVTESEVRARTAGRCWRRSAPPA